MRLGEASRRAPPAHPILRSEHPDPARGVRAPLAHGVPNEGSIAVDECLDGLAQVDLLPGVPQRVGIDVGRREPVRSEEPFGQQVHLFEDARKVAARMPIAIDALVVEALLQDARPLPSVRRQEVLEHDESDRVGAVHAFTTRGRKSSRAAAAPAPAPWSLQSRSLVRILMRNGRP